MEQELEIDTPCSSKESSREVTLFSVYLDELFPYALMWGMTPSQYWYEDSSLASAYRDKFDLERKLENQKLWYQGAYIYAALCQVAPLYSLKPQKPEPYLTEPFPLSDKEQREMDERKRGEEIAEYMNTYMANLNKKEG